MKRKIKIILNNLILFSALVVLFNSAGNSVLAQSKFQLAIGGTGDDYANAIALAPDGGYTLAGTCTSFGAGNYDFYIVKLTPTGTIQWTRTIGGTGDDEANAIAVTNDGGYIAAGYTNSYGAGNYDVYVTKVSSTGSLLWSKAIGGSGQDYGYAVVQTSDRGYAIAGYTTSFGSGTDVYVVKLDSLGTLQWSKAIGGSGSDYGYAIIQTSDGGYAITGQTNSYGAGNGDVLVLKLHPDGSLQWAKTVGGSGYDYGTAIIQTTDGGYAIGGVTASFGAGTYDDYIVKLDSTGALQWTRTAGGSNYESIYGIVQTSDGGYAAAGFAYSYGSGQDDLYLIKLSSTGTLLWSKTTGGTNYDYADCMIQAPDGGFVLGGYTASFGQGNGNGDFYVVKLDSGGNSCNSTSPSSSNSTGGTLTTPNPTVTSPTSTVTTPAPTTSTGGVLTTICISPPVVPVLIKPVNNAANLPVTDTLVWNGFSEAASFRLQVATDTAFSSLILDDSTITNNFRIVTGLNYNTSYYWRVNAKGIGGTSLYSAAWKFTTTVLPPPVPVLQYPPNGSVGIPVNTLLYWSASSGASAYRVQVATDSVYGTPSFDTTISNDTIQVPSGKLANNTLYYWHVRASNTGGNSNYSASWHFTTLLTGISSEQNPLPKVFRLYENYPNPFNPECTIKFDLPKAEDVKIIIYDVIGQEVALPVNSHFAPGSYSVKWDGANFPSGVYFYRINAGRFSDVKKMILLK